MTKYYFERYNDGMCITIYNIWLYLFQIHLRLVNGRILGLVVADQDPHTTQVLPSTTLVCCCPASLICCSPPCVTHGTDTSLLCRVKLLMCISYKKNCSYSLFIPCPFSLLLLKTLNTDEIGGDRRHRHYCHLSFLEVSLLCCAHALLLIWIQTVINAPKCNFS